MRARWNILECEGDKENKRKGGGNRDRLDTCMEEKKKERKKERNENVWMRMN